MLGSEVSEEGTTQGWRGQRILDHENKESIYMRVEYQAQVRKWSGTVQIPTWCDEEEERRVLRSIDQPAYAVGRWVSSCERKEKCGKEDSWKGW